MSHFNALLAGTLLLLAGSTQAAAPAGPVVVELFTSQGCNSCPPADALLGELARRPGVITLALHVTYWNDLGWEDKFSQAQFDERQLRYVQQLGLRSSYTPQMVVNGVQDVVGSQRGAVNRVLAKATPVAAISVHREGEQLELALPALAQPCNCVLTLFGLRSSAKTPIGRGENGGHTLEEFQVVRAMQSLGKWQGDGQALQVRPVKMPSDVDAYVVLAQERASARVVAAGQ